MELGLGYVFIRTESLFGVGVSVRIGKSIDLSQQIPSILVSTAYMPILSGIYVFVLFPGINKLFTYHRYFGAELLNSVLLLSKAIDGMGLVFLVALIVLEIFE